MNHKELVVWKTSMELLVSTYSFTSKLPRYEQYGITSQMNRAALSIPSNIAEGAARNTTKEYIRFLYIAMGSASELETQYLATLMIPLARNDDNYHEKILFVLKLLYRQIKALKNKI